MELIHNVSVKLFWPHPPRKPRGQKKLSVMKKGGALKNEVKKGGLLENAGIKVIK